MEAGYRAILDGDVYARRLCCALFWAGPSQDGAREEGCPEGVFLVQEAAPPSPSPQQSQAVRRVSTWLPLLQKINNMRHVMWAGRWGLTTAGVYTSYLYPSLTGDVWPWTWPTAEHPPRPSLAWVYSVWAPVAIPTGCLWSVSTNYGRMPRCHMMPRLHPQLADQECSSPKLQNQTHRLPWHLLLSRFGGWLKGRKYFSAWRPPDCGASGPCLPGTVLVLKKAKKFIRRWRGGGGTALPSSPLLLLRSILLHIHLKPPEGHP
mmetsp:Transcript_16043/g.44736  ORF Transcript_16043/g.44736 Transcript_16043/m.44736 type:complete len:262 (-) Transcript_16043:118-903(-)